MNPGRHGTEAEDDKSRSVRDALYYQCMKKLSNRETHVRHSRNLMILTGSTELFIDSEFLVKNKYAAPGKRRY